MARKVKKVTREEQRKTVQAFEKELQALKQKIDDYDIKADKNVTKFDQLPISKNTLRGITESSFISMTDIQKESIPLALKGNDILAAARTGSGKTLSFVIPVIERLVHEGWNEYDGVGALIISPTRELAMQIYEVLLKVGKHNTFSAGLVIGGKDYAYEKDRIGKVNILIGTPGRLLQHMDQSSTLNLNNLQCLVLDEADRILDMGFKKTLDSIVSNLPPDRQTLLFSATQTKSVQDLARLSLVNPTYINTSSDSDSTTPDSLEQSYIVTKLPEKLDILWSFMKSHLDSKILVFASSSKQVHYIYESFRKLQPGISLMKLHGRQKQKARIETTVKFSQAQHCCLFATDVVARGLDFPAIDWVIQLDCPEDVSTYIHRVGRCARFGRAGKSMLMLTPSEEEPFLKRLESRKIDIKRLTIKGAKKKKIQDQLQSLCFKSPELKYLGQKAFISYFKSIYIQNDKEVFDVTKLPLDEFAKSLGLPGAPKIKLLEKAKDGKQKKFTEEELLRLKEKKNASRQLLSLSKADDNGEIQESTKVRTKYDKMFERKNQSVLSEHYLKMTGEGGKATTGDDGDDEDDFMSVKRKDHELKDDEVPRLDMINTSKRATKKALSKKLTAKSASLGNKLVFDDEGVAHPAYELENEEDFHKEGPASKLKEEYLTKEKEAMTTADAEDKDIAKEKKQEKKRKRKELERMAMEEEYESGSDDDNEEGPYLVTLGKGSDAESDADLDKDLEQSEESDEEERPRKKTKKWFEKDVQRDNSSDDDEGVIELEQPETIDDLEALTERLLQG